MNFRLVSVSFLVALTSFACQSANKLAATGASGGPGTGAKAVVPTAPPLEVAPTVKGANAILAHAMTAIGDNIHPRFSPDGSKILFLSASRPSHRQYQVYELDLTRMTERRVTFHDGDDFGANWAAGGQKIVYSSVTDEMKENLSLDRLKAVYDASKAIGTAPNGIRSLPKSAGGEIYLQRLDGREIDRLTNNPSVDVYPTADVSMKSTRIVFSSDRDHNVRLYLTNGQTTRAITQGQDTAPAFSLDGKWLVWERRVPGLPPNSQQTQLMISPDLKKASPLTSPGFQDDDPSWGPKNESIVFSSNRGGKTFDLYLIDRNGSCLKRLTQAKIDLLYPSLSPDGTKIAFSAKAASQNQIYIMDNRAAQLACAATPPSGAATATPAPTLTPSPKPTVTPAPAASPSPSASPSSAPTPTPAR